MSLISESLLYLAESHLFQVERSRLGHSLPSVVPRNETETNSGAKYLKYGIRPPLPCPMPIGDQERCYAASFGGDNGKIASAAAGGGISSL